MLHYSFLKQLIKSKLKKYKQLILKATGDELKAITHSIQVCANQAISKQNKLLKVIQSKTLSPKKLVHLLVKHRALVQAILCVAFQMLVRMSSFAIVENDQC